MFFVLLVGTVCFEVKNKFVDIRCYDKVQTPMRPSLPSVAYIKTRAIDSQICFIKTFSMILPQVHLRKPCYDFYFL